MKEYRIKVIEKHFDIVTVRANSKEDAIKMAIDESDCKYDLLYDCEFLSVDYIEDSGL